MTLVVSQVGAFSGGAGASVTPTITGDPIGLVVIATAAMNNPPSMKIGGVNADAVHSAYGGISSTQVAIGYWLDISSRVGDLIEVIETHGGATQCGYAFIEATDLRLVTQTAFASGGSVTTPSTSPTVAGGNVAAFVCGCKYSGGYSAGTNCTTIFDTRTSSRDAYGGYGVGGADEAWSITMAGGASTGGWEAGGYTILEEQGVPTPRPSMAIVVAS